MDDTYILQMNTNRVIACLTLAHHSLSDKTKHDTGAGVTLGGGIKRSHHQLMSVITTSTTLIEEREREREVVTVMEKVEEDEEK